MGFKVSGQYYVYVTQNISFLVCDS